MIITKKYLHSVTVELNARPCLIFTCCARVCPRLATVSSLACCPGQWNTIRPSLSLWLPPKMATKPRIGNNHGHRYQYLFYFYYYRSRITTHESFPSLTQNKNPIFLQPPSDFDANDHKSREFPGTADLRPHPYVHCLNCCSLSHLSSTPLLSSSMGPVQLSHGYNCRIKLFIVSSSRHPTTTSSTYFLITLLFCFS